VSFQTPQIPGTAIDCVIFPISDVPDAIKIEFIEQQMQRAILHRKTALDFVVHREKVAVVGEGKWILIEPKGQVPGLVSTWMSRDTVLIMTRDLGPWCKYHMREIRKKKPGYDTVGGVAGVFSHVAVLRQHALERKRTHSPGRQYMNLDLKS
jgi:hypothetical protein